MHFLGRLATEYASEYDPVSLGFPGFSTLAAPDADWVG